MDKIYILINFFKNMMKMHYLSTPRKTDPTPMIKPIIIIPIHSHVVNTTYPFSSLIERVQYTGPCSSCGGK